jgi:predicted dehydrogenase
MNQAPHHVDLFIWLGGSATGVSSRVDRRWHRIEVEDTVEALLDYGDGKTGYFYTTTSEWPGETHFELAGESGKLEIVGERLRLYRFAKSLPEEIFNGPMWGKCDGEWQEISYTPAPQSHAAVIAQFARAVKLDEPLVATGEDGRRALELANALLLSGNRQKPVSLPLDRDEYDTFLAEMRAGR